MNIKLDIIMSLIILFLIIIYKVYQFKRYKLIYVGNLYKRSNGICKVLLSLSILIGIGSLLFFYINKNLNIRNVLFSISFLVCVLPINLFNMYRMFFLDEEKYTHIKTVITNKIPDKELFKKYLKAGINIVIFSKEKLKYKIDKVSIKDINRRTLKKCCIVNSDDIKVVNKYLVDDVIVINNDLDKLYDNIYHARGVHDNYIRSIKYIFVLYFSILVSNIVFMIGNFPACTNISIMLLFKLLSLLCIEFIFKDLKYDIDIMDRKVKDSNVIVGKQECLLLFMISMLILFAISIPYMFIIVQSDNIGLVRGLYYVILIYCMLFFNYYNYSEKIYIINIINSFKSIRMIIYLICSIVLSILISKIKYLYVSDMVLKNYFSCILISLIICIIFDVFKFSRWLSNRRKR